MDSEKNQLDEEHRTLMNKFNNLNRDYDKEVEDRKKVKLEFDEFQSNFKYILILKPTQIKKNRN